jgi:hypothetical protein
LVGPEKIKISLKSGSNWYCRAGAVPFKNFNVVIHIAERWCRGAYAALFKNGFYFNLPDLL